MRFAGWFSIAVGLSMFAQWAFFLAAGQVPELRTAPWEIALHLVAELATAIALLVAGWGLLRRRGWAAHVYRVAAGMLLYTVVVSSGYFAQRGQWAPVGMFAIILVLALLSLRAVRG